jgi:hypothetical protein
MTQSDRRARIRSHLGIEPISHGQVYTFQVALPESDKKDISPERCQILEDSLFEHKTNLVPLIVRRTQDYSEEQEYEVVYGADWCFVAKKLDIEKLWVWVYDMTDEQAAAAKAEMEQLTGSTGSVIQDRLPVFDETKLIKSLFKQFEQSFQKKLDTLNSQLNQASMTSTDQISVRRENIIPEDLMEQLEHLIDRKIEPIIGAINDFRKQLATVGGYGETRKIRLKNLQEKDLEDMTVPELKIIAKERKIPRYSSMKKAQILLALKETGAS